MTRLPEIVSQWPRRDERGLCEPILLNVADDELRSLVGEPLGDDASERQGD